MLLKHRYVEQENKAEYVDNTDFADVDHDLLLANLLFCWAAA